ncbi:MAG TPA: insulinase family protein, partial [Chromatiales bacterium]|nr:insulinase family protein [Chromatiales bacterium]
MKRLLALCLLLFAGSVLAGPRIQHWTLPSGLSVYFLEAHELPMVDLKLVFDAGSARDGDLPGLASMTAGELFSGTRSLDLETLSDRLDRVGADYGAGALRDMAWIALRSLTDADALQPALDTWLQVVGEPAFPAEHFERARRQRLVALRA